MNIKSIVTNGFNDALKSGAEQTTLKTERRAFEN